MAVIIGEDPLEQYILEHSSPESPLRAEIYRAAHVRLIRPRMLSGHLQGNLLKMIAQMCRAKLVLELGTYTGYAAHCLAEALPEDGRVHTLESDDEMEDFIRHYINRAEYGHKIKLHIGDAMKLLPELMRQNDFDLVYIDANKRQYPDYYKLIIDHLHSGAVILADNTLWDGKVALEPKPSDVQTQCILEFNAMVQADERVENLILPLRDGLTLIRVK
ncbi:O-methyltransferase [Porphyromonas sp. COT-290 OH3588]|uniref:O-methyltransferase n=1 Tax=Porphyromonas sp. COT-290 OH3588 TaxID=1515617 RepID=UPI00052C3386|nr:class I SAM-dependent methyltransferase [Porphyromonas sp. COT-290 OH3588]KGN97129.1 methyltransferase [Porphyromonas sp. COT-290 OH3588]